MQQAGSVPTAEKGTGLSGWPECSLAGCLLAPRRLERCVSDLVHSLLCWSALHLLAEGVMAGRGPLCLVLVTGRWDERSPQPRGEAVSGEKCVNLPHGLQLA